jgi:hypothetical protein
MSNFSLQFSTFTKAQLWSRVSPSSTRRTGSSLFSSSAYYQRFKRGRWRSSYGRFFNENTVLYGIISVNTAGSYDRLSF